MKTLPLWFRCLLERTARLRLELRRKGRPITHRALDLVIAATALERNLVLVTRNSKDYVDVADLTLL